MKRAMLVDNGRRVLQKLGGGDVEGLVADLLSKRNV
jgi:hypothetical protein